jgi:mono/diheme cytochrome c family protein
MNTTNIYLLIIFFLLVCSITSLHAGESTEAVNAGAKEFQQRCALCHGDNGKGDGPYAMALVFKPSNLTTLLADNDGVFPFLETYLIIDGREIVKSHGPRLMPIWGDRYNSEAWSEVDPEYGDTLVRGRILELLLFLYSIQEPVTPN